MCSTWLAFRSVKVLQKITVTTFLKVTVFCAKTGFTNFGRCHCNAHYLFNFGKLYVIKSVPIVFPSFLSGLTARG
jgi:hypothetical protein